MKKLITIAAVTVALTGQASAGFETFFFHHHYTKPTPTPKGAPWNGSGGNKFLWCPTPAGWFICAIAVAGIIHELEGPACSSDTPYNRANGYDSPAFWRPLCSQQEARPVNVVRVRG